MTILSTKEARDHFSELLSRVAVGKERIVLARGGKELVAVVPVEDLMLVEAAEDLGDLEDARAAREEAFVEGTTPLADLKRELVR